METPESRETREVQEIELTSEDGMVVWSEVYKGGGSGDLHRTGISTSSYHAVEGLMKDLKEMYPDVKINPPHT